MKNGDPMFKMLNMNNFLITEQKLQELQNFNLGLESETGSSSNTSALHILSSKSNTNHLISAQNYDKSIGMSSNTLSNHKRRTSLPFQQPKILKVQNYEIGKNLAQPKSSTNIEIKPEFVVKRINKKKIHKR